jgi:aspartate 1-decarboxylase
VLITVCKSKIHRATITDANLNYVGSITIDADLITAAGLYPFEKVLIANVNNGERFESYVMNGPAGSGMVSLNGAAARKGEIGDLVIIIAFGLIDEAEVNGFTPRIVHVDHRNKQKSV